MKWEDDFHGAMKNFIKEGRKGNTAGVEAHIQALRQAINQISVRTKSDQHNIDIAKLHLNHIRRMCRKLKSDLEESRLEESVSASNYSYDSGPVVLQTLGIDTESASEAQKVAADLISLIERDYFDDKVAFLLPKSFSFSQKDNIPEVLSNFSQELNIVIPVERIYYLSESKNSIARKKKLQGNEYRQFTQAWEGFMTGITDNITPASPLSSEEFSMSTFSTEYVKENIRDLVKYLWQVGGLTDLGAALSH